MTITATEFKTNFGFYLEKIADEDILITKNGKVVAQLIQPKVEKLAILSSLLGIAKGDPKLDLESAKNERLQRQ